MPLNKWLHADISMRSFSTHFTSTRVYINSFLNKRKIYDKRIYNNKARSRLNKLLYVNWSVSFEYV